MSKFKDLTNKVFNRLTVIKQIKNSNKTPKWLCRCSCGNYVEVQSNNLISGEVKSCGCLRKEL